MKIWIVLLCLGLGFLTQAQEVESKGTTYKVKGKIIQQNGVDVTETLTIERQNEIRADLDKKLKADKEAKKLAKAQKNAEKAQKQAEKKQKKAEKELRLKQKAQDNFEKAGKKYEQALEKYEKLKKKGKLSPNDEVKWLEKIEKLKEANEKAEKKLKRA